MPVSRNDEPLASDDVCRALLDHVLKGERAWLDTLAPGGEPGPALADLLGPPDANGQASSLRERWLGLLGNVLWDVFSDNNDVVGPAGEVCDLGSFRGSGAFLADVLNGRLAAERAAGAPFFYLDFYMGTMRPHERRLRSLYGRVFERLRERGCDWRYAPPALGLVRLGGADGAKDDPATYDPVRALREEAAREAREAGDAELERSIAEGNERAFHAAAEHPPEVVLAYREVYGAMPTYVRR